MVDDGWRRPEEKEVETILTKKAEDEEEGWRSEKRRECDGERRDGGGWMRM